MYNSHTSNAVLGLEYLMFQKASKKILIQKYIYKNCSSPVYFYSKRFSLLHLLLKNTILLVFINLYFLNYKFKNTSSHIKQEGRNIGVEPKRCICRQSIGFSSTKSQIIISACRHTTLC